MAAGKHSLVEITVTAGYVNSAGQLQDPCGKCVGFDARTNPPTISGWVYDLAEAQRVANEAWENR